VIGQTFSAQKAKRGVGPVAWHSVFFDALIACFCVTHAAAVAGKSDQTVQRWWRDDADFRRRWGESLDYGYARAEMDMLRIAIHGETSSSERETLSDGRKVRRTNRRSMACLARLIKLHHDRLAVLAARDDAAAIREQAMALSLERVQQLIAWLSDRRTELEAECNASEKRDAPT
jgi:hypothetical protein